MNKKCITSLFGVYVTYNLPAILCQKNAVQGTWVGDGVGEYAPHLSKSGVLGEDFHLFFLEKTWYSKKNKINIYICIDERISKHKQMVEGLGPVGVVL